MDREKVAALSEGDMFFYLNVSPFLYIQQSF